MATERDTNPNDFFVAGGTLRASAPSYVLRPADDELFEMAAQGAFCYVLTPRQMGKSSLMIRTAKRLGEQGVRAGIVDLTQIGAKVTVEQWYLGLLSQLRRSLKLETDYAEWWAAHSALGVVQRFTDFLREVVLTEISERVVIFIDEIDSTLQLDFRDDFFAAIRAMYNARAETADFQRLSFVLLGVASPPDLIRDLTRTPFNIGQAIALREFSRDDAAVLQEELEKQLPGKGEVIFERVYGWTNGHPYLTQKLCLTIAEKPQAAWGDAEVDALVGQMFLTEEARKESNLQYVQNNILSHELKLPMLKLYRNVVRGGAVAENQSREQNQLKLSGLVKAEGGALVVRNRVYGQVFDGDWVRANIPVNWTRRLAVAASASLVVLLGLFVYFFVIEPKNVSDQVQMAEGAFFKGSPKERITAMATIVRSKGTFDVTNNHDTAIQLFYAVSWEEQLRLFDPHDTHEVSDRDLVTVIKALYVTMADVDGTGSNLKLLEKMYGSLEKREKGDEVKKLRDEIKAWLDGAMADVKGDMTSAERDYFAAISLNASNPAARFTRGKFFAKTNRPADALNEFNEVILIAQRLATTTKSVEPTATVAQQSQSITNTASATVMSSPLLTEAPSVNTTRGPLSTVAVLSVSITVPVAPLPTPLPIRFVSRFATSGQMIVAVRDFVAGAPDLLNKLATSPVTSTIELREVFPVALLVQVTTRSATFTTPTLTLTSCTSIDRTTVPLPEVFPQVGDAVEFRFSDQTRPEEQAILRKYMTGDSCRHTGSYGIQLIYTMTQLSHFGGWGVLWDYADNKHFDAAQFTDFEFWVKGKKGTETFQLEIADVVGKSMKAQVVLTNTGWSRVRLSLADFNQLDMRRVARVQFFLQQRDGTSSIYVDDMAFVNTNAIAPAGFNFETGTQHWQTSEGSFKLATLTTTNAIVYSGRQAMQLETELSYATATSPHTEAVIYFSDGIPEGLSSPEPYDLTNKRVSCFVYLPSGWASGGTPSAYMRLFVKDTNFANQYSEPVDIDSSVTNRWIQLSMTVHNQPSFDSSHTHALAIRFELQNPASFSYRGSIYIDHCEIETAATQPQLQSHHARTNQTRPD